MPICSNGHDSATEDYCDHCGIKIGNGGRSPDPAGSAAPAATAEPGTTDTEDAPLCPLCQTPKAGRFCERDGYDFFTASLQGDAPPGQGGAASGQGGSASGQGAAAPGSGAAAPEGGVVLVVADRGQYDRVVASSGPDAGGIHFPEYCPQRRFELRGDQMVIGRFSRSRGITPDIDLVGPPEDPGVSHLHAMLVAQPDGGWAVVDLGSANGTYVNGAPDPIPSETPVPLHDGDHVNLGAWTKLTVRLGG